MMDPEQQRHDYTQVYRDIAAEHGIDPTDIDAVTDFHRNVVPTLATDKIEEYLSRIQADVMEYGTGIGMDITDKESVDKRRTVEGQVVQPLPALPNVEDFEA